MEVCPQNPLEARAFNRPLFHYALLCVPKMKNHATPLRRYFGHGSRKCHFQQHAWGYFAFKRLLPCSDDESLPLVEKLCDSMGFRAANRLRADKVRTAGCFPVQPLLRIMKRVTGDKQ